MATGLHAAALDDEPRASASATAGDEHIAGSGRRRFDAVLIGTAAALAALTAAALLPGVRLVTDNGNLDIVLNTLTALAAAGAAALAWIRYRIERDAAAIYESSAFLVLCVTRSLIIGIAAFGSSEQAGMSLDHPLQWPLYGWSLARLASATLLVVAASSSLRRLRSTRLPVWVVGLGPVIALLLAMLAFRASEDQLPRLLGPGGIAALRGDPGAQPGMELIGLVLQAVVAVAYFVGAWLYRRSFQRHGRRYAGYLAIALVVAGFSQFHWATYPGIYRPLVTVDDLLRALFSVILLMGIEAQFRGDVMALRAANARLEALRRREAERAGIEASARLARELHDGLSHDLWLAKLAQGRLVGEPQLSGSARSTANELGEAIDRALGNARSVVASMRSEAAAVGQGESLQRIVEEFESLTGIRAEVEGSGVLATLPEPSAAEVIRIVGEALTNVRRHADATTLRVTAVARPGSIEVSVVDNGRGFDPGVASAGTFGIRGMRERADLIGAGLRIDSRPSDGTRVVITIPRPPAPDLASANAQDAR